MALVSRDSRKCCHKLLKWYLDELLQDKYICSVVDNHQLKTATIYFCNVFLAAGILQQVQDKNVPNYIFQLDQTSRDLRLISSSMKPSRIKSWFSCIPGCFEELSYPRQEEILRMEDKIHQLQQEITNYQIVLRIKKLLSRDVGQPMICDIKDNTQKILRYDVATQTKVTNATTETQTGHDMYDQPSLATDMHLAPTIAQKLVIPLLQPESTHSGNDTSHSLKNLGTLPVSQITIPMPPPLPPPLHNRVTPETPTATIEMGQHLRLSRTGIEATDVISSPAPLLNRDIHLSPPPPRIESMVISFPPPVPSTEEAPPATSHIPPPASLMTGITTLSYQTSTSEQVSSGPIPPPMPYAGTKIPPQPPITGKLGPPPAPPLPGMAILPAPPLQTGIIPIPPSCAGPVPLPPAPVGGWNAQKSAFRKPKVDPTLPMKPLYWTRILTTTAQTDSYSKPALWVEIEEFPLENLPEFVELFSRQVIAKKAQSKNVQHASKLEPAKLLDSKRSRNVGILSQSLRVDIQEIENAIYNCDNSSVSFEALRQIYEARATEEELVLIKSHIITKPDIPLDKPEQFLYHLSKISHFDQRISCLTFQVEFGDSISEMENTLNNMKTTCEHLMNNPHLKDVMAIILTLGNYMNGGNISRGQADGFGLEILSKLKDVKSKDSKITLLHFIVKTYLLKIENPLEPNLPLPVPESDDIRRAASVSFDDTKLELEKLQKQLQDCKETSMKIIETSSQVHLQPFKDRMAEFLEQSNKHTMAELNSLEDCRKLFEATMRFYLFKPKSGTLETATPVDFFKLWQSFCRDFKDIYKMELMRLQKQKCLQEKKCNGIISREKVTNLTGSLFITHLLETSSLNEVEQILIREHERTSGIKKIRERPDGLKAKVRRYRQLKEKERQERERDYSI